ncbi:MAG: TonB-dependent receptor [Flavobacteriales bacterium]|nr:TonB-dependent receptor [Flavobacteriales bacterium]
MKPLSLRRKNPESIIKDGLKVCVRDGSGILPIKSGDIADSPTPIVELAELLGKRPNYLFAMLLGMLMICGSSSDSWAQEHATITVIDAETSSPLPNAHVYHYRAGNEKGNKMAGGVTDRDGLIRLHSMDDSEVIITYIGYHQSRFAFTAGKDTTVSLKISNTEHDETVVTGQFSPAMKRTALIEVGTISKQELEQKGAQNLDQAINDQMGFHTNAGHANETALTINGLSGEHVKVMVDGIAVEGRLKGNIDLSQIMMNDVERIEIIKGPVSAFYGTNSLAGVINIISKKTQARRFTGSIMGYYESVGQYDISGNAGYSDNLNTIRLSGGRNYFSGYATDDTSRYKDWKPREQYFGKFLYDRQIKHLHLTYKFEGFTEEMTSRGQRRAPYYVTAFDTYYRTNRLTNSVLLKGRVGMHHFLDVSLGQSWYQRNRNIYYRDLVTLEETLTSGDSDQDTTWHQNYTVRAAFSSDNDSTWFNYLAGVDFKYDRIVSDRVEGRTRNVQDYALFGGFRLGEFKGITVRPAARATYNSRFGFNVTPTVNVLYEPTDNLQIRASYSRGFRAPSLKELFLEFHFNSTINLYGREGLNPETSDQFRFSTSWDHRYGGSGFRTEFGYTYNHIRDMIDLVATTDVDWTYTNIGQYEAHGIDANAHWKYGGLKLSAGVETGFRKVEITEGHSELSRFKPQLQALANASYNWKKTGLFFRINYKYNGKQYSLYLNQYGEVEEGSLAAYSMLDASIGRNFWKDRIALNIGVKNLLNVDQVEINGKLQGISSAKDATTVNALWGRSFFASLAIKF